MLNKHMFNKNTSSSGASLANLSLADGVRSKLNPYAVGHWILNGLLLTAFLMTMNLVIQQLSTPLVSSTPLF